MKYKVVSQYLTNFWWFDFILKGNFGGDKVSMMIHTYPPKVVGMIKWLSAITRLTAHFTCGVMFDLVICKQRKRYSRTSYRISLLRLGVMKQLKPQTLCFSRTLAMIKPDAVGKMGHIIDMISQNGIQIARLKMCRLNRNEAFEFYQEHQGKSFFK